MECHTGDVEPVKVQRLYRAVDWGYVRFVVAVIATGLVCLHVAMGGGL